MALRSKSITITPVRNRNGSISYRVMGTVRPKSKQRRQHFCNLDDAMAAQALWESERMQNGAALRPKITRLTQAELAQAEAAVEVLRGTGLSLIDAARHVFGSPVAAPKAAHAVGDALASFLAERKPFVGERRYESLKLTGDQFVRFVGEGAVIAASSSGSCDGFRRF